MFESEAVVVGLKIIAMFLVMAVGYFCRRGGLLDSRTTSIFAKFCTDITLPALIFVQLVDTVDLGALRVGWTVPLLASAGTALGFVVAWANWRLFATRNQAPVFIFSSGISNWVYLPLPIVATLYGSEGMQTLFLCNLGIQVLFWTLGVAILHGGRLEWSSMKNLATNPGLIATFLGIAFALVWGAVGADVENWPGHGPMHAGGEVLADAMRLLGQATIPVSLVVTGAQIAASAMVQSRPVKALAGMVLNRMLIAPALALLMLCAFAGLFPVLSSQRLLVIAIVLLMPTSVTSTVLTERMNQDTALAAQAVLYTTLASIVSVPLMVLLARAVL